jgi:pimeloyl-ACP methyl ester carboxylesterase
MESIILLHGAFGSSMQLQPLAIQLSKQYKVHVLDFSGHGSRPMPEEPFSIQLFMNDILNYMELHRLERVSLFGYSMGGYVAAYMALHHPEKINRIVTLATKYLWDEHTSAKMVQAIQPEQLMAQSPEFIKALEQEHVSDWEDVVRHTIVLLQGLGEQVQISMADLGTLTTPCLLMLGDRDRMVPMAETLQVYQLIPNAQMAILPATPHALEKADAAVIAYHILRFIPV